MSHQYYKPAKSRLHRSELAVPGSSPKMFDKALNSNADYIFLDLEDAVSPNDKIQARANVIKALREINWREKGKTISVRINSLDTHYMYSDLVEIVEQAADKVDTILVPKAGTASDVYGGFDDPVSFNCPSYPCGRHQHGQCRTMGMEKKPPVR